MAIPYHRLLSGPHDLGEILRYWQHRFEVVKKIPNRCLMPHLGLTEQPEMGQSPIPQHSI